MTQRPTLHVIGCGRAASAVARRLVGTGQVEAGVIVNRGLDSARRAASFIGGGEAAESLDGAREGDWVMLGLPDGVLADEAFDAGARLGHRPGLVFHLSGSAPASALAPAGVPVASVHPVRAFSDPEQAADRFEGTWCVAEGDSAALKLLRPVFEAAGGRWLPFEADDKAAWHASTVAASNFLVTIQALARSLARQAGLPEDQAADVLCDLQQGVLDTLRARAPIECLTGPIERGDAEACRRLESASRRLDAVQSELFRDLGLGTLALARDKRGERQTDALIRRLFSGDGSPTTSN